MKKVPCPFAALLEYHGSPSPPPPPNLNVVPKSPKHGFPLDSKKEKNFSTALNKPINTGSITKPPFHPR